MSGEFFRPLIGGEAVDALILFVDAALDEGDVAKAQELAGYIRNPVGLETIPFDLREVVGIVYDPSPLHGLVHRAPNQISYYNIRECIIGLINEKLAAAASDTLGDEVLYQELYELTNATILRVPVEPVMNPDEVAAIPDIGLVPAFFDPHVFGGAPIVAPVLALAPVLDYIAQVPAPAPIAPAAPAPILLPPADFAEADLAAAIAASNEMAPAFDINSFEQLIAALQNMFYDTAGIDLETAQIVYHGHMSDVLGDQYVPQ